MQKKKYFIFILPAFIFCFSVNAQDNKTTDDESRKEDKEVIIDGNDNDWPDSLAFNDAKANINYGISNDQSNLYLFLKTNNDQAQVKILNGGLITSLNGKGKKKQDLSIRFPLEREQVSSGQRPDLGVLKALGFANANQFELEGFNEGNGRYDLHQNNNPGIKVSIGFNKEGNLIYEALIPFAALYNKQEISTEDSSRIIAVCFSIKGLPKPEMQQSSPTQGATPGRSSRSTNPVREQPTSMQNKQNNVPLNVQLLYQPTKTWKIIKVKIGD